LTTKEVLSPGTPPPADVIPLIVPELRGNEWQYMKDCLDTNWVSSVGSYVDRFEQMVAAYVGVKHAVATVNGTAALHIAMLVAGVEPEDEVVVSTLTFIAPANAVRYAGAWPVFIDAESRSFQIDPAALSDFLENGCTWDGRILRNRGSGRRVRAILPVHILGHPVDLDPILAVAEKFALPVIEDATEGLGARYRGKALGSFGRAACFSFNGNKIITTGGGGMLVTDDAAWAARARYLTTQAKDNPIEYVHNTVGFNYRLTNVLAAMGCAQMEKLDDFVTVKRQIAARYQAAFASLPGLIAPSEAEWAFSTYWMFTARVDEERAGISSRELLLELDSHRIQARPLWQPMHCSPAHEAKASPPCPRAEELHRQAISLPCSVGLTTAAQDYVIETVTAILSQHELPVGVR
jgi:perosamine synthetase